MALPEDAPCPRLCHLIKWPDFDGYGFNLHAEKNKSGQFIGKVDDDSPAVLAGLREGDKIIEVNFVNISNENHRQVVERIKSIPNETRLLVLDEHADKWYRERKMVVKSSQSNVTFFRTPVPRPPMGTLPVAESSPDLALRNRPSSSSISKSEEQSVPSSSSSSSASSSHTTTPPQPQPPPPTESISKAGSQRSQHGQQSAHSNRAPSSLSNGATSTASSSRLDSGTDSPQSSHSSINELGASHESMPSVGGGSADSLKMTAPNGTSSPFDLNLNMTASEMRQIIAQRKKKDAKKANIDLREKYEIIQQM